ncbi:MULTISPECIES: ACP S-malonyltransferase [unclassified Cocleimonas]|uniref:ACP S-malonyltransferase n=1 Tax=unclassified Cocleimonas TaxID=2639732 RepID=UPI002DBFE986|nr:MULTISPECIES: ACP S-malonyltransferase [unclassified Cocleimonas]
MQFAAVFPGQGSQSIGMLGELATEYSEIKATFEEASDAIGIDLWSMTTADDATELNKTENTQPVMLAAGVSVWKLWLKVGGGAPVGMAGHSLGEYSALVAAGVIDFKDAMRLVAKRSSLMQQAVPAGEGAMAAILGLEDNQIVEICSSIKEGVVEAVNFNSPGQVVIAGNTSSVDAAIEKLSDAGAKRAIKLPVSVPSHCSLMKDAATQLSESLLTTNFNNGEFEVLQNVEAISYASAADKQSALAKQLYKPVLWTDTINNLNKVQGADTIIEFGPGKVLFGLNRRINRALGSFYISDPASLDKALEACNS